jgi:thymidine phosphorylase
MIRIARGMGKAAAAFITDMDQPLGRAVGNSLEVIEAFEALKGRGPEDFLSLCRRLSARMLVLGRAADDDQAGAQLYDEMIMSGAALEKMREIIAAQSGDPSALDEYDLMPRARHSEKVFSARSGYVLAIDAEAIGHASMKLGAGRLRLDTPIDLSVGLEVEARIGDRVDESTPLVTLHFNEPDRAAEASGIIRNAYNIGEDAAKPPPLIKEVLD